MQIIIYNILLNEDAQYDKNIRVITRKALESIRNFLLRHMSNEEIAQLLSSIGSGNPLATNTKTPVLQRNFTTNSDNINFIKIPTQRKLHKVEEQRDKAQADAEYWKNEYYRAYADTKNLRSQLERDHLAAMKYRAEGFIDELLPVLDSFYTVLKNEPTNPELKNYLIGRNT